MQFLLAAINAKYIHTNPALYSLRAYAGEELRPFITLAEYTINNRMEEILGDLYKRHPDALGLSCYIWNFDLIRELIMELPKVLPDTDIWLGGPEVSFEAESLMKQFPKVKGIMIGEGEETFKDILTFYAAKNNPDIICKYHSLREIPGLVLRDGATPERGLTDFDGLPFIYENLEELENKIIYYETSRGCPFRCSYCLSSIDKQVRLRDMNKVKRELQFFLDHKVPQVKLIDRTFNCNKDHAMDIWKYIRENDNNVTNFHFEIAADIMQEDELELLKTLRPGLAQLEIGVQTTNRDTLREINRPTDISRIARVVREILKGRNIHVHLDLIAGLPLENYESFQKSFNEVYAMRPHQLQLGFLKVLKGTVIWEKADLYGIVYGDKPPYEVLYTKWISYDEILKLKRIEEMVELYYNSGQFKNTLLFLMKEFDTPFSMYEELADFYEQKGYFVNSPARSHRYHVLLEFVESKIPEKKELFKELLTLDFYLRENAKSRPSFAADLSQWRDEIWKFYQQEEEKPHYLTAYADYHARATMKMTHMEVFYYPVWQYFSWEGAYEDGKEPMKMERMEPSLVLFDYEKRDVLTGEAAVYRI
ncbi:MAG: B12-binding domain-containing radical SAM protein [Bacillota bacterium]|nr:B12-binding domain-containing radical SAM protein [Bacillota bacterium]